MNLSNQMHKLLSFLFIGIMVSALISGCGCKEGEDCDLAPIGEPVIKEGSISSSEIWSDVHDDENTVDYCIKGSYQISSGAKLTIQEGVIISFEEGAELYVNNGELEVKGTAENKVIFTGKQKTKGYWNGIYINAGSSAVFDHCVVEYGGGKAIFSSEPAANIQSKGSFTMTNTTVDNSAANGLTVFDAGATISSFQNNSFNFNQEDAIYMRSENVYRMDETTLMGFNGFNGVHINDIQMTAQGSKTWKKLKSPAVYKFNALKLNNTDLTLEAGVTMVAEAGGKIEIQGSSSLTLAGSENDPVIIEGQTRSTGYWDGLYVLGSTNIDHSIIRNGGGSSVGSAIMPANIGTFEGVINITNSTVSDGAGCGIALKGQSTNMINADAASSNTFSGLSGDDICQ